MTTIIAKEHAGEVYIGFDSLCTGGDQFELEQDKVFVNNGVIYGVAGRLLLSTELKHAHMPAAPEDVDETDSWMTSVLSPKIRHILNQIAPRRNSDDFSMQILVVVNNRVYEVSCDSGWHRRVDGQYAIGSGSPYASGALAYGASIQKALSIAANTDPYTGGRLTVTTARKLLEG
jgi:ATP-dependent protease HslVU (ClpYQ) peptidase subunit